MKLKVKTEMHSYSPGLCVRFVILPALFYLVFIFAACNSGNETPPATVIVPDPKDMDRKTAVLIEQLAEQAFKNKGRLDDSITLRQDSIVHFIYDASDFKPAWSSSEKWTMAGDAMFAFIGGARTYGLFPDDYHFDKLSSIRTRFSKDTMAAGDKRDAALWARAEMMLTDAFVQMIHDVKFGRLPADSITMRKDTVYTHGFFKEKMDSVLATGDIAAMMHSFEPVHNGYHQLKAGIRNFLDSADLTPRPFIHFPTSDTNSLKTLVAQRLVEEGYITLDKIPELVQLKAALKKYQEDQGLVTDGKIGPATINSLNNSGLEKFIRIAITLDRYKMLPADLPPLYIWVNLPGFYLELIERDTVKIFSKTVIGKPYTRTPVLTSILSDMITYPQWTVPQSIIEKEILPAAKKDPGYFAKKGFSLVNNKGEEIDPWFVDWSLYRKGIPYKVVQGSGDDNALGVLKFNFGNKYAVYLHDTNQRYLFSRSSRALSHGCVRVQNWDKLAYYIIRNDSLHTGGRNYVPADSVKRWLNLKQKKVIPVRKRIPLFIRYFTCVGKDGKIIFYDDVYGEDRRLRVKYFSKNNLL